MPCRRRERLHPEVGLLGPVHTGDRDHPVGGVFAPAALAGLQQTVALARDPEATHLALHLTERQIEVFHLLSQGCATKTIARRLGLAVGTVKVHLAGIYRVLGAHNRVEAIARAGGVHVQAVRFSAGAAMEAEAAD